MPTDTNKPVRAAKAAALKNPVWLDRKAPASAPVTQKRPHSPDVASATTSRGTGTKQARTVAKMRPGQPAPQSKTRKNATSQPPRANARANTKARLPPVKMDVDSGHNSSDDGEGEVEVDDSEGENDNLSNGDPIEGTTSDSDRESATNEEEDELDSDYASDIEQDGVTNAGLDASAVREKFEKEGANWGTGDSVEARRVPDEVPHTSGDDKSPGKDENPGSQSKKSAGKRAAHRLAEVPQWEETFAEATCTDSGTPFSSGEDDDVESDGNQASPQMRAVNKGWTAESHYVPPNSGRAQISLRNQPAPLRMIIRTAINKTTANIVFDTAYRDVDRIPNYLRHSLWATARSMNERAYAKRFQQDGDFGKVIGRVLNGRLSIFRGQVKRNAASKVEGYYHLVNGQAGVQRIKDLVHASKYIYPTRKGPDGQDIILRSKPFAHPAIITVLCDSFFVNVRGGSFAGRNYACFESSVKAHPEEREIPPAMLALVATSIHSALDDHANRVLRKTDFNADLYEDIYRGHIRFLSHIREESVTKYHRMMAGLYSEASSVFVPRAVAVTNEAILQLDLDGMDE